MNDCLRFLRSTCNALAVCLTVLGCYGTDDDDGQGGGRGSGGTSGTTASAGRGGEGADSNAGTTGSSGSSSRGGTTSRGGSTSGGSTSGGSGGLDLSCRYADANGFFSDCSACPDNCDTIDDGASIRYACGCSTGCPCGLTCGCFDIAPDVGVCDICMR